MTNDEAKRLLEAARLMLLRPDGQTVSELYDALGVAIEALDAVPVVHGEFVKNETGVNRHCTACGAYMEDSEYENHTVRYCYYCGAKMKGKENADADS